MARHGDHIPPTIGDVNVADTDTSDIKTDFSDRGVNILGHVRLMTLVEDSKRLVEKNRSKSTYNNESGKLLPHFTHCNIGDIVNRALVNGDSESAWSIRGNLKRCYFR